MKSDLKISTSFVSPLTLPIFISMDLLPIFIIRNIKTSDLIGCYSDTSVHCKILSPSTELFRKKRDKKITLEEFHKGYAKEISEVDLEQVLREWEILSSCSHAKGLILLGYGSSYESCHRSTLTKILNNSELLVNPIKEFIL